MESPQFAKANNNLGASKVSPGDKMSSSLNSSTLEDTTPSDSGIQMLDSENSDAMIESIGSYETAAAAAADANSNMATAVIAAVEEAQMITSACSTFDTTEKIVYRRKVHKTSSAPKAPKKRVSFHEDILKNTRTDNIHIEHGFITYKNGRKLAIGQAGGVARAAGRYSWCVERNGDDSGNNQAGGPNEISAAGRYDGDDDDEGESGATGGGNGTGAGRRRRLVYRNACSDVLDYGHTDIYDTNEPHGLQYDNSGVFEYAPPPQSVAGDGMDSSTSSNSSMDSDEQEPNSNTNRKSSSCDCIGMSQVNNNFIGNNCYYSEPNIGVSKSVWNKEKKPKSSCLKKPKRQTNIIQEQDLNGRMKKFNVHDSSKMIFGSLKSIFTMPLPERGVPEGSEDLQAVIECVPELEQTPEHKLKPQNQTNLATSPSSPPLKAKPFLSKSLDGNKQTANVKKFVHNVDQQLRHKNDDQQSPSTSSSSPIDGIQKQKLNQLFLLQRQDKFDKQMETVGTNVNANANNNQQQPLHQQFRSKFIINCESTVFEHTGVSYETSHDENQLQTDHTLQQQQQHSNVASLLEQNTPIAQPASQMKSSFMAAPIAKTFSNFFRSLKEGSSNSTANTPSPALDTEHQVATDSYFAKKMNKSQQHQQQKIASPICQLPNAQSSSTISELSSISNNTNTNSCSLPKPLAQVERQTRHLASPLKKRGQPLNQPARYGDQLQLHSRSLHSPCTYLNARGGSGRDSKSTILSDDFDDILTITTTTDTINTDTKPSSVADSDLVIVDYTDVDYSQLLKPPHAKTSLINRFLRNVTQKKIMETSIRRNNFFADKLRNEQKNLGSTKLYVKGARPKNYELIDDLNAEIAMEIEMSGANSPRRELINMGESDTSEVSNFELGIGEISIDIFNGKTLSILSESKEQLMKVFKLYTGYSQEGFMTPVLVLLTDRSLYVTDLVRNCLCAKFVLAYKDLDVILMGPFGNTVLLSNSTRDMQQVLLAGGPYPADALVANLELCARRSGSTLPAVGQLTMEHLAPLQAFVRANSCVGKDERWMFYAVVNVPVGGVLSFAGTGTEDDQEPLGPNMKGFLMHRRVKEANGKANWQPGYFLLKAGVLYMFHDSNQKLPSWAMALAECQGARRTVKSLRPHCFELLLKKEILQLAAPDEYVASEWLQSLLQSASGLFELQEKHKTLGCSLIVTQNHLITLREDFSAPLRQIQMKAMPDEQLSIVPESKNLLCEEDLLSVFETSSLMSSTLSTPTRGTLNSTPTKQIQSMTPTPLAIKSSEQNMMSSVYGKNSGLQILTCADIKAMTGIKISSHSETWWCILEFSCQEAPLECLDDLVIFFASSMEMQRFLRLLEQLWQAKNNDLFPITVMDDEEALSERCTALYTEINRGWEPLLTAALGYPL
ncbi:uncharacterized protein LOC6651248 [Drosophila willistoni]|uniref:uncharacterized protein LOC6651248 n=1 Tax=Drosophila willistoni TaxID=7260 RepID=UPI000C26CC3E|nr:uncharacterized protein LOC6651248 [Drosophila willistoni]